VTEYRSVLERAGTSAPPPDLPLERILQRRDSKRRNQRIRAGVLGIAIAVVVGWWGIHTITSTAPKPADPSEKLGIFAPVSGRIVFSDGYGIWGIDPSAPAASAERVQLIPDHDATPLGWSRDGTELLVMRLSRSADDLPWHGELFILHADGSETQVAKAPSLRPWDGATISPDGSRVVFVGPKALYGFDVDAGSAEVLHRSPEGNLTTPTFSPDGTQVAFVDGSGDHDFHIWVMNADGSDAHEILFNETTAAAGHVIGLAWSPAGDRIAIGFDVGIYTFAPDGSAFTRVIWRGTSPYWSPDGSQIANTTALPNGNGPGVLAIADADGSNHRVFDFGASGPWHPGQNPSPEPTDTRPSGLFAGVGGWITYGNNDGIWAVDPAHTGDPGARIQLSPDEGIPLDWSPDGSELLVSRSVPRGKDFGHEDLYLLNADGTWTRLTDADGGISGGSFSPDGSQIVYSVWPNSGHRAIYIDDVAGGAPRLVTKDVAYPYHPTLSPDGSEIAYFDGHGDWGNSLRVINVDGSDVRELTGPDYGHTDALVWSPDGSRLAFSLESGGGLFIVGADGSGLRQLASDGSNPAWSPDGSRISYEQSSDGLCPRGLRTLKTVTVDGTDVQELGCAGSGAWNPLGSKKGAAG
jgi:Tol biopolymer transport system component